MKYDVKKMKLLKFQQKTYKEIATQIGCSEWTVKYHLMKCRKNSSIKYDKKKKLEDPLFFKRKRFLVKNSAIENFSLNELKEKLGVSPKCYLTGENIDLLKPHTYCLDHIIPISRGGKSSLENLGILKYEVNQAKYNLTPDEFISMCKRVVNESSVNT